MNIDYKAIGARIKARRRELKITQETLAEMLSVSIGYVSQVERGATKISLDLLARISDVLKCDISQLVSGSAYNGKEYLSTEIFQKYERLTAEQKRFLLDIIGLMLKEKQ